MRKDNRKIMIHGNLTRIVTLLLIFTIVSIWFVVIYVLGEDLFKLWEGSYFIESTLVDVFTITGIVSVLGSYLYRCKYCGEKVLLKLFQPVGYMNWLQYIYSILMGKLVCYKCGSHQFNRDQ